MHTETTWLIEIDKDRHAKHTLNIHLFNPRETLPTLQDYIAIQFSEEQPLEQFQTKVDGTLFPNGYGFNQDARTYYLKFEDIPQYAGKPLDNPSFKVDISFKQREIARKTMDMNILDVPFSTNFRPSSIELIFKLPKILNPFSKLAYYLAVLVNRKKDLYEIEPLPTSFLPPTTVNKKNGEIIFHTGKEIKGPIQFAYRFVGEIDVPSLVLGAILIVVTGVIVKLLVDWIYSLFGR